jgi:CBS domain-containing protein
MLTSVARDMWDGDCGCVPVVDADNRPVAMVTDRDIAMASFLTGEPLHRIPVKSAASQNVHTVRDDEPLETALDLMKNHRVRRLPVVDGDGRLVGVLSAADIARAETTGNKTKGASPSKFTWTLSAISEPWKSSLAPAPS